jgi:hypothetical protein
MNSYKLAFAAFTFSLVFPCCLTAAPVPGSARLAPLRDLSGDWRTSVRGVELLGNSPYGLRIHLEEHSSPSCCNDRFQDWLEGTFGNVRVRSALSRTASIRTLYSGIFPVRGERDELERLRIDVEGTMLGLSGTITVQRSVESHGELEWHAIMQAPFRADRM